MLADIGSITQAQNTQPADERFASLGYAADVQAIFAELARKAADAAAGSVRLAQAKTMTPAKPSPDISHDEYIRLSAQIIDQRGDGRRTLARLADTVTRFVLPSEPVGSTSVHDGLAACRFDPEMARLATITGVFPLYRAWLYVRTINDGSGKITRSDVCQIWKRAGVATSDRHVRRLIKDGDGIFWHIDRRTKRLYVAGVERLAVRLYGRAQDVAPDTLATNTPGNRHSMLADLSGDIGTAQAVVYAAWLAGKSDKRGGVTIARDTLSRLWRVSVPTLLSWEIAAGIGKQANYAQAPDGSTATAPAHAYLNLHRDGSTFSAWRLPNTYYVRSSMKSHDRIGKARKVRQAITQIADTAQRGFKTDAALPVQTKRYFVDSDKSNAYKAAETYVRRIGRNNGDIDTRRYFAVGMRHGVAIFEPFDRDTTYQKTNISQRNIWQEMRTTWFLSARRAFRLACADIAKWR